MYMYLKFISIKSGCGWGVFQIYFGTSSIFFGFQYISVVVGRGFAFPFCEMQTKLFWLLRKLRNCLLLKQIDTWWEKSKFSMFYPLKKKFPWVFQCTLFITGPRKQETCTGYYFRRLGGKKAQSNEPSNFSLHSFIFLSF